MRKLLPAGVWYCRCINASGHPHNRVLPGLHLKHRLLPPTMGSESGACTWVEHTVTLSWHTLFPLSNQTVLHSVSHILFYFVPCTGFCLVTSYLCLCRVVRGAVGHGDAHCIEMAGLCGSSNALCDFCLLCCIDHLHPAHHGGTLSFSPCASFTLVRKCWPKLRLLGEVFTYTTYPWYLVNSYSFIKVTRFLQRCFLLFSFSWFWPPMIIKWKKCSFLWTIANSLGTVHLTHDYKSYGSSANQTLILFLWRDLFYVDISFPLLQGGISKQVLQWIRLQTEPFFFLFNDQCSTCYMTDQTLHIDNGYVNHCTVAVSFLS